MPLIISPGTLLSRPFLTPTISPRRLASRGWVDFLGLLKGLVLLRVSETVSSSIVSASAVLPLFGPNYCRFMKLFMVVITLRWLEGAMLPPSLKVKRAFLFCEGSLFCVLASFF